MSYDFLSGTHSEEAFNAGVTDAKDAGTARAVMTGWTFALVINRPHASAFGKEGVDIAKYEFGRNWGAYMAGYASVVIGETA